ncbi:MAG TPA: hypothetical protein VIP09_13120 [Dehalococcoidia bacterium]
MWRQLTSYTPVLGGLFREYELEAAGAHGGSVVGQRDCVEYKDAELAAIQAATASRRIVVEAAVNEAENLDHADYNGK